MISLKFTLCYQRVAKTEHVRTTKTIQDYFGREVTCFHEKIKFLILKKKLSDHLGPKYVTVGTDRCKLTSGLQH